MLKRTIIFLISSTLKKNTKKIWDKIKELKQQSKNKTVTECIKINNINITDKLQIANLFNVYYTNIAPKLDKDLPASSIDPISYLKGNYPHSMRVPLCTATDTINVIKTLKNTKYITNFLCYVRATFKKSHFLEYPFQDDPFIVKTKFKRPSSVDA